MKTKKRLMLLGGISYLLPVIKKAQEMGVEVVTADYLPDNIAHKYSDIYVNVSILDREAVLAKAQELEIDGIMSFGVDPGVVTAAYVAEKMGLPFQCSYEAATILQDKGLFRQFLIENGFNCPKAKRYHRGEDPAKDTNCFTWPVIVKPVDSAGSKGITKVDAPDALPEAVDIALANAHGDTYIVEDFIEFEGFHSSADPFVVDGKLVFAPYSDHHFEKHVENPYTPIGVIFPTTMKQEHQDCLTQELQRLMTLLKVKTGIFNIETCVGKGGIPYIMEVSPRGGGCKIAELQDLAFGTPLVENEIRKALSMPLKEIAPHSIEGHWCEMVVHAQPGQQGFFDQLVIDEKVTENNLRLTDIFATRGSAVRPLSGANCSLGNIFLQFNTREELNTYIKDTTRWLKIVVDCHE